MTDDPIARELAEATAAMRAAHESDDDDPAILRRYHRARFAAGERCICPARGDPDAPHKLGCMTQGRGVRRG